MLRNILKSKIGLSILVLFLTTIGSYAQFFNVIYVDTTSFPVMKAGFIAKDGFGGDFTGVTNNSFELWENGINYAASAKVECKPTSKITPVTVAMVLDVSGSMDEDAGNGEKRIRWIQDAAKMFFDTIKLVPPSSASIITFATTVTANTGWQTDNAWFKNYLEYNVKIASGNTNFFNPFEEWKSPKGTYESFKNTNPNVRRVIIFISDGEPQTQFLDNESNKIIAHCKEQKTEVYSIMITSSKNDQLEKICNATGGKIYSIWTKDDFIAIYQEICGRIQSTNNCELIWTAPMNCDATNLKRDLRIVFKPIPDEVKTNYNVPANAVVKLDVSETQLLFGAPGIGTTQRQLTLTAKNGDFNITKETLTPNKKFKVNWGKTLPFLLKKDASHTITIDYTESPVTASDEVLLTIAATPCPSQPVSLIAPCGGDVVATSDLGDVALTTSQNKTITCGFKNTTFVPISGEAKLGGTNASEFSIVTGGGNFTLNPGQCLDLVVKGSPTTSGTKTAYVEYIIPSFCGTPKTNLTMNAINSNFPMPTLDYQVVRKLSSKDLTYTITNSGSSAISITDIALSNPSLTDFVVTKPSMPQTLAAGAKLDMNVKFTPTSVGLIENNIVLTIQSNPNKPSGKLTGIGGLPEIKAVDVDFGSVKILATKPGNIVIQNNSTTMDLSISSITINSQPDFAFGTGATLTNVIVKKSSSTSIPVDFTPQSAGLKTATVTINNDAVTGPTVTNINTTVKLTGTGVGFGLTPNPLNFGDQITCGSGVTKAITFKNESSEAWTITNAIVTGSGSTAFLTNIPNATVAAGATGTINVTFVPTAIKSYSANLEVTINAGSGGTLNGVAQLLGNGVVVKQKASFAKTEYSQKPNFEEAMEYSMPLPNGVTSIDEIEFTVKYYDKMFNYLPTTFAPGTDYAGWTWTPTASKGQLVIKGKGTPITSGATIKGSFKLSTFLSDKYEGYVSITPKFFNNNVCVIGETDSAKTSVSVCFNTGNLITIPFENEFALYEATPNPAGTTTKITFDIGFKENVKLELFNSMGVKISTLKQDQLGNGRYEVLVNTEDLPDGIYYYRLSSSVFTDTKKLVITK